MKIREYLDLTGCTQKDMAEAIGVCDQYIWNIASGVSNPSASVAHRIYEWSDGKILVSDIRKCNRHCAPGCACSKK